jgi:hypothetical protein
LNFRTTNLVPAWAIVQIRHNILFFISHIVAQKSAIAMMQRKFWQVQTSLQGLSAAYVVTFKLTRA